MSFDTVCVLSFALCIIAAVLLWRLRRSNQHLHGTIARVNNSELPYVYDERHRRSWGSDWYFTKQFTTISGHQPRLPRVDDRFHVPMKSGRIGIYIVTSVYYPGDPTDMFTATVHQIGFISGDGQTCGMVAPCEDGGPV